MYVPVLLNTLIIYLVYSPAHKSAAGTIRSIIKQTQSALSPRDILQTLVHTLNIRWIIKQTQSALSPGDILQTLGRTFNIRRPGVIAPTSNPVSLLLNCYLI